MVLDFQHFQETPPADWNESVSRLGGTIFHSTHWAEYQKASQGCTPIFLQGRDESGNLCAAAIALYRRSAKPVVSLFSRHLELTAHPCIGGAGAATALGFIQSCEGYASELGCARLTINSNASGTSPFVPSEHGYTESNRLEFVVDLTHDTEQLWNAISKDQRNRVRQLERKSVDIDAGTTREDLSQLKIVRESAQERRAETGQHYELSKDSEFYDRIFSTLVEQDAARLFVARREGEVIAAILFAAFNAHAYSIFSGSTPVGYKLGAQCGLFWNAVETFKSQGFKRLNRGGVPASAGNESDPLHGIYRFKKRLGTTPVLCRSGEKVISQVRDQFVQLKNQLRR